MAEGGGGPTEDMHIYGILKMPKGFRRFAFFIHFLI